MDTKAYAAGWTAQFETERWCAVCIHANNLGSPYVWCKKDHAHYPHDHTCGKWEMTQ
jgi:hypothetical protein